MAEKNHEAAEIIRCIGKCDGQVELAVAVEIRRDRVVGLAIDA
jgi:hypothetical protein